MRISLVLALRKESPYTTPLIHELDTDEIVAVLAHEVGHYKRKPH